MKIEFESAPRQTIWLGSNASGLSMLTQRKHKYSVAMRRRVAGWNRDYLAKIIGIPVLSCALAVNRSLSRSRTLLIQDPPKHVNLAFTGNCWFDTAKNGVEHEKRPAIMQCIILTGTCLNRFPIGPVGPVLLRRRGRSCSGRNQRRLPLLKI